MKMSKFTYCIFLFLFVGFVLANAQPKVIAHRGYWDVEGAAQNSVFALQKAQELKIYGAEFDVLVTADGIPVVNHDPVINGITIENVNYAEIKDMTLSNGERIPTLEMYLRQGKTSPKVKLILEIKSHSTKEKEDKAVQEIVDLVKKTKTGSQVEYIAFSLNVCKEILQLDPKAKVAYLNGDISPRELSLLGISGIDYHFNVLQKNKNWIDEAHQLGMSVNVWTVNDPEIMKEMISAKVDYITTDKPSELKKLAKK